METDSKPKLLTMNIFKKLLFSMLHEKHQFCDNSIRIDRELILLRNFICSKVYFLKTIVYLIYYLFFVLAAPLYYNKSSTA